MTRAPTRSVSVLAETDLVVLGIGVKLAVVIVPPAPPLAVRSTADKVRVTFKPTTSGPRSGLFVVRQGAAGVQIPLSGTGL